MSKKDKPAGSSSTPAFSRTIKVNPLVLNLTSVFTAGYALWSQIEANYWGHNAIIRVQPFMECCGLPMLPGKPPLGGEILSHDFVEAAYMRKGGWKVAVDKDLSESYEQCPTNLIDFAKRDQRWCQGNLQHIRLAVTHGLRTLSRAHLGMGAMAYLASPLWAVFLLLIILMGLGFHGTGREGQPSVGFTALLLFGGTFLLLLLPKFWALFLILMSRTVARRFGGGGRSTGSVFLEIAFSVAMAPILMAFHTTFVIATFLGRSVRWEAQRRGDYDVSWSEAFHVHAPHIIAGLAGTLLVILLSPYLLLWMLPVLLPLILAAPLSKLLGSQRVGAWLLHRKLLVIPQEIEPPRVIRRQRRLRQQLASELLKVPYPFIRVIVDPAFNALHVSCLPDPKESPKARTDRLIRIAIAGGAAHLTSAERMELLCDAAAMEALHKEAWHDWPPELLESCSVRVAPRSRVSA